MSMLIVIESLTDDNGNFEAVIRRDDGKIDKRVRYGDGDQGDFLTHIKKLYTPKLLVTGKDEATVDSGKSEAT